MAGTTTRTKATTKAKANPPEPSVAAFYASEQGTQASKQSVIDDEFDGFFDDDDDVIKTPSHEDNADPVVLPNLVSKKPGALRTRGEVQLHTRLAHRLFYGRRRDDKKNIRPITGLVRFAINMNQINDLAARDDPYADQVLLEVEAKLIEAESTVKSNIAAVKDLLADLDGITIKYNGSVQPVTVPLEFKTTYGFLAARLLYQYDKLVRMAQAAMHVGMMFESDWAKVVRASGRLIRHAFGLSAGYRFSGVNRDDIAANNAAARAAKEKHGELPQSTLDGSKRGKFAPKIIKAGQAKK